MPPFNEGVIKAKIADGRIGGLSLDTSIFDKLGRNLNSQPLLGLAQFRHGPTKFLLSEVVVGELKDHLRENARKAKNELMGKIKGVGTHWHQLIDASAIEAAAGLSQSPEAFADSFFSAFVTAVDPVMIDTKGVDTSEVMRRYFAAEPPFADKETKKHEFPDAMALLSLEAWAKNANTLMLVVSGDQGWRDFCEGSAHLYCLDELPPALNLFNEDEGVVVRRALAMLRAGEAKALHDAISSSLEGYLENSELDGDADSFIEVEVDHVEPIIIRWEIHPSDKPDVISSDDDSIVFSVLVTADIEFIFHLLFRRWDKEDREYMRMGSRTVPIVDQREIMMTIIIARNVETEPEVIDINCNPDHIFLEIGDVDPYDC